MTLWEIFNAEPKRMARKEPKGHNPFENILTGPEVAELKGVAKTTVVSAIQSGRLPAWEKGRMFFVRRADAEAWHPIKGRGPRPKRRELGNL